MGNKPENKNGGFETREDEQEEQEESERRRKTHLTGASPADWSRALECHISDSRYSPQSAARYSSYRLQEKQHHV